MPMHHDVRARQSYLCGKLLQDKDGRWDVHQHGHRLRSTSRNGGGSRRVEVPVGQPEPRCWPRWPPPVRSPHDRWSDLG